MRLQLSTLFLELCVLASQYDPGRTRPIVSNVCATLSLVDVRAEELVLRDGGVTVTLDGASVLGSRWCDGVVSGEEHNGVALKMKSFNKTHLYIMTADVDRLRDMLTGGGVRMDAECDGIGTLCIELVNKGPSLAKVPSVGGVSRSVVKRRSSVASQSGGDDGGGGHSGAWYIATVVAALVVLSVAGAMCVKSGQYDTNSVQSPPVQPPAPNQEVHVHPLSERPTSVVSGTKSISTNNDIDGNSSVQEASVDLVQELSSPSEHGSSPVPRPMSVTSSDDPDRARTKRDQPLPNPPQDDLNRAASVASLDELGRPKPRQSQPPHEDLDRPASVASLDELGRPKPRKGQPLPDLPKLDVAQQDPSPPINQLNENQANKDDDEEEDPYDYAIVPGQDDGAAVGNDDQPEVPPDAKRPGSYAKVTRHSDPPSGTVDSDNPYAKVRDFGSRNRSATDPPNPTNVLPSPLPRTMTAGNSNLPLPLPPRDAVGDEDDEDDTYDSIDKKPETFDDEDAGMYESVPEDLKEGLGITSSLPIPVPPRSPRPQNMDNVALSPVKKAECPPSNSPANKKGTKRDKKKGINSDNALSPTPDDHQKKSFQLFSRKRSSSSSTTTAPASKGKGKKQSSPDHTFRILTGPPPGMEDSGSDQEAAVGSNNSPNRFAEAKKKSSSLPRELTSNRTSMYNPHVNEPLPEVPEDSGSGTAVLVKRDRVPDTADPSYDIVVTALSKRDKDNDEDEQDDNYDTVESLKQSRPLASVQPPISSNKSSNPPAMPVPPPPTDQSGNDAEYAVVDPSVIERKRAASISSKRQQESDRPYDRVKNIEQFKSKSFDDADEQHQYAQVNMVQKKIGRMNKQLSHPSSSPDVEPSSPPPVPPIGYLDNRPESATPPVPEQILPLTEDEPPYSKVKKQGNNKDSDVEDETQREYEDIDDLLPARRSKPPSLPAPRHSSTSQENTSSGETALPSPRAVNADPQSPSHDSLEQQQQQQPVYDSLEQEHNNVYDTLDPLIVSEI